ncbi:MAG TPA: hypothetical protein DEO88_18220 [Syntrophobacteraceae bacterium]|nr:hypothetical protein [Syntrophobacteraceae bacterium]
MWCISVISPMWRSGMAGAMADLLGTTALGDMAGLVDHSHSIGLWGIIGITCFSPIPGMAGRVITTGMEATVIPTMDMQEYLTGTVEAGDQTSRIGLGDQVPLIRDGGWRYRERTDRCCVVACHNAEPKI